jgi:hypothetical protein
MMHRRTALGLALSAGLAPSILQRAGKLAPHTTHPADRGRRAGRFQ